MTAYDLTGRVAVVTGGSRGIGRAIVTRLHQAGARVGIVARDGARARSFAAELGPNACAAATDVASATQVTRALGEIETALGPIDILVNNAGVTRDGLLLRMSEADWDAVLDVNLKGAFHAIKAVTRGMMKRRFGRIINIASVVGLAGNAGQANYAASKAGLIGLTKSVAKELASRNILVNAIAPGFIDTDLTRELSQDARQRLLDMIPLARLGTGEDVAGAVLFLASDHASYITGQVLVVDGGMVI